MRKRRRGPQPTVTYAHSDGQVITYKVRGNPEIPDFSTMERFAVLQWMLRHTYPRGYSRPNALAGMAGVISVGEPS